MRAGPCDMAPDERVPIHLSDLLDLSKVRGDVLSEGKSTPRHPTREHDIHHHQYSLGRGVNKNVPRLVSVAVVRKFEYLVTDAQCVLVGEGDGRKRAVRIRGTL